MAGVIRARLDDGIEIRRLNDVPVGWEWQGVYGQWHPMGGAPWYGSRAVGLVACRPRKPKTEYVPWHEAAGRLLPSGRRIHHVRRYSDGSVSLHYVLGQPSEHCERPSALTVEVLIEGVT